MFALTLIALIITYLLYRFYNYFTFWQRQNVRTANGLLFAWAFDIYHEFAIKYNRKYGKIFGAYWINNRILFVNDAKLFRDLSIKDGHKFPERMLIHFGSTNLRYGLFMMTANENWKRVRSIVSPAFTSGKLKTMLTPINRLVDNFIQHLNQYANSDDKFDIKMHTNAFAMNVIALCGYGIDVDSFNVPNHPIVTRAKLILSTDSSISQIICFMFPFMGKLLNLDPFHKESCQFLNKLTFEIIKKRQMNDEQQNKDLIGLMMEHLNKNDENIWISKEEIAGQGLVFFLAGFDTTNSTLCHLIYNLIKHQNWQQALFEELSQQEEMNYDLLKSLPVLNAIINETLRLYPPLSAILRSTKTDSTLLDTGIKIPANTTIITQPYVIHRNPEYFPEPNEFKPERFMGENSAETNIAFIPFGVGPRLCVGMRFAQNELRALVSQLVLNYHLLPDDDLKLQYFRGNVFLSPKNLMVRIKKRVE